MINPECPGGGRVSRLTDITVAGAKTSGAGPTISPARKLLLDELAAGGFWNYVGAAVATAASSAVWDVMQRQGEDRSFRGKRRAIVLIFERGILTSSVLPAGLFDGLFGGSGGAGADGGFVPVVGVWDRRDFPGKDRPECRFPWRLASGPL